MVPLANAAYALPFIPNRHAFAASDVQGLVSYHSTLPYSSCLPILITPVLVRSCNLLFLLSFIRCLAGLLDLPANDRLVFVLPFGAGCSF